MKLKVLGLSLITVLLYGELVFAGQETQVEENQTTEAKNDLSVSDRIALYKAEMIQAEKIYEDKVRKIIEEISHLEGEVPFDISQFEQKNEPEDISSGAANEGTSDKKSVVTEEQKEDETKEASNNEVEAEANEETLNKESVATEEQGEDKVKEGSETMSSDDEQYSDNFEINTVNTGGRVEEIRRVYAIKRKLEKLREYKNKIDVYNKSLQRYNVRFDTVMKYGKICFDDTKIKDLVNADKYIISNVIKNYNLMERSGTKANEAWLKIKNLKESDKGYKNSLNELRVAVKAFNKDLISLIKKLNQSNKSEKK